MRATIDWPAADAATDEVGWDSSDRAGQAAQVTKMVK
jgi:hypothetical protein